MHIILDYSTGPNILISKMLKHRRENGRVNKRDTTEKKAGR